MSRESRKEELERVAKTYIQEYLCFSETLISTFIKGAEYADKHPISPWIFVADKEPCDLEDMLISQGTTTPKIKNVIVLNKNNEIKESFMLYTKAHGWIWDLSAGVPVCWMLIPEIPKV